VGLVAEDHEGLVAPASGILPARTLASGAVAAAGAGAVLRGLARDFAPDFAGRLGEAFAANARLRCSTALRKGLVPSASFGAVPAWNLGDCHGNWFRSGCGIRPSTRPVGSVIPATSSVEPFGLNG
jgi:hypothetical protein